ncbi:uncharacterized protein C6orf136 homolog [Clinocottus analis]|uniref:uncharacterized protein C6orf136 homolog n=1 Tax=Clinocottus analis TaxID=304258 RepID=UPI0035BF666A
MAVSRRGVAFWVGCVRSHGRRPATGSRSWSLSQAVDWQWTRQIRPRSSASWALVPPNSLRYQSLKRSVLSHPFHHASLPQTGGHHEEDWEAVSVCVLVRQGESDGLHAVLQIPLLAHNKLEELLAPGPHMSAQLSFLWTTVDGCREDDISVGSFNRNGLSPLKREHGCFRSLFEAETCPAPFTNGSHFYCFHCPATEPGDGSRLKPGRHVELKPEKLPLLPCSALCGHAEGAQGDHAKRHSEEEEKLALMYERLRIELPSFFMRNHDYTMYSNDVEFINGLINTNTRGRTVYQLSLSLWRLLCLCYYAKAGLEVLKLTKHMEDGTIKARWRIRGLPFYSLLLRFYRKDKSQLYRSYDAFSTFYIGQDGLIHCHKVEKVMPDPPPVLPRVTSLLAGALVALGVQEPRPALNLLPLLLSSLRQSRG